MVAATHCRVGRPVIVAYRHTMPTNCIACGCLNRAGEVEGISFHIFPKEESLRRKWITAIRKKDWQPSRFSRICSAHFREKDIDRTSQYCVRIREGAVPTIFAAYPREAQVSSLVDQYNSKLVLVLATLLACDSLAPKVVGDHLFAQRSSAVKCTIMDLCGTETLTLTTANEISSIGGRVSRKKRGAQLKVSTLEEEEFHHPGLPDSKKIKIEIDSDGEGGVVGGGGGGEGEEEGVGGEVEENKEEEEEEEMNMETANSGGAVNGGGVGGGNADEMIDIDESALLEVKKELINDDPLEPQVNIKVEEPSDVDEEDNGGDVNNDNRTETNGDADDRAADDSAAYLEEPNRVFLTVKQEFASSINEENGLDHHFDEKDEEEEEDSGSSGGGGGGGVLVSGGCSNDDVMLISAVRQYRELYDSWHLYYSNSWRRNDCWALVAKQINCTAEKCQIRWNQIRENYRKSRKRGYHHHRLDDHLSFLDEFCRPRRQYLVGNDDANNAVDDYQIVFNTENGSPPPPPQQHVLDPATTTTTCESVSSSSTTCGGDVVVKDKKPKRRSVGAARPVKPPQDVEATTRFLELYAGERLLYDTDSKLYRDQEARHAAAQRISDALQAPEIGGARDVAKRFKNLRDSYCHELKKKAEWERTYPDEPYSPKLFYFEQMNAFLKPFVWHRKAQLKPKLPPPPTTTTTDDNPNNNIGPTTTTTNINNNNNNMTIMTNHHLHHSGVMLEQNMIYHNSPPPSFTTSIPQTNIIFSTLPSQTNILPFSNISPHTSIPAFTTANRPPPPPYPNQSLLLQLQSPLVGAAAGTVSADKLLSVIVPTTVTVPPPTAVTVPPPKEEVAVDYQSSNSGSLSPPMVIDADPLALDADPLLDMDDNTSDCSSLMEPAMFEVFSERELVDLPTRELNQRLRGLPAQIVRRLKMKRRTLKNRSYANNSRTKRSNRSHQLEMQNKELMDKLARFEAQLSQVRAERDFYKKQCQTMRGADSSDKLLSQADDFDQAPQSLAQLLLQLPSQSPPPLRPLSPKVSAEQLSKEQLTGTGGRSQLSKEQLSGTGGRSQLSGTGSRLPPPLRPLSSSSSEQLSGTGGRSQLSKEQLLKETGPQLLKDQSRLPVMLQLLGLSPASKEQLLERSKEQLSERSKEQLSERSKEQLSESGERSQLLKEQLPESDQSQLSETGPQLSKDQSRLPVVSQLLEQSPLLKEQLSESDRLLGMVMGESKPLETEPQLSKGESQPLPETDDESKLEQLSQLPVKSPPSLEPLSLSRIQERLQSSQTMEQLQSPQKLVEEVKPSLEPLPEPVQSQEPQSPEQLLEKSPERLPEKSPEQLPEKSPEKLESSQSQSPEKSPSQLLGDSKSPVESPCQSLPEQAKSPVHCPSQSLEQEKSPVQSPNQSLEQTKSPQPLP